MGMSSGAVATSTPAATAAMRCVSEKFIRAPPRSLLTNQYPRCIPDVQREPSALTPRLDGRGHATASSAASVTLSIVGQYIDKTQGHRLNSVSTTDKELTREAISYGRGPGSQPAGGVDGRGNDSVIRGRCAPLLLGSRGQA
jgi:hypothetical protein